MKKGDFILEPYKDELIQWAEQGLSRTKILNELSRSASIAVSYSTLVDYLRILGYAGPKRVYVVREHETEIREWVEEGLTDSEIASKLRKLSGRDVKAGAVTTFREKHQIGVVADPAFTLAFFKPWV